METTFLVTKLIRDQRTYIATALYQERLGAFLNQQEEIVDFTEPIESIETKRNEVKHILLERDFITACDFCNGSCESTRKVNAAIQLKR